MGTKWSIIAPITSQHNVLWKLLSALPNTEFHLGNGVRLVMTPELLRNSHYLSSGAIVGEIPREEIRSRPISFVYDFEDPAPIPSPGNYNYPAELLEKAQESIRIANICLWIAQPLGIGFEEIFDANDAHDGFQVRGMQRLTCIVPHSEDVKNLITLNDLTKAMVLNSKWAPVSRNTPIGLARAVISKALLDDWGDSRYLLFWVALEALFAPSGGGESTYRLAIRMAKFLERDSTKLKDRFSKIKNSYRWRSNIAHGRKGSTPAEENEIFRQTESLLRDSLVIILAESQLIDVFNGSEREPYLEAVALGLS